jgi:hypothetical protein
VGQLTGPKSIRSKQQTSSVGNLKADRRSHRHRLRRTLVVLLAVGVPFVLLTMRFFVWPELPELPARADAIIELAGPGNRDGDAIALAQAHRATLVIQSTVLAEAGTNKCLPPIPDVTIMCFHPDPGTTRGEARYIGALAAQRHWRSVILVTTPDHAWRARLRVMRCFPGEVYVSVSPLPAWEWPLQIPYQWAATTKALIFQTDC